jgi:cytochrome c-type biogenesis protein CcmH/NrfG
MAVIWDTRGLVLHRLGRHDEALASYAQAYRLDPTPARERALATARENPPPPRNSAIARGE